MWKVTVLKAKLQSDHNSGGGILSLVKWEEKSWQPSKTLIHSCCLFAERLVHPGMMSTSWWMVGLTKATAEGLDTPKAPCAPETRMEELTRRKTRAKSSFTSSPQTHTSPMEAFELRQEVKERRTLKKETEMVWLFHQQTLVFQFISSWTHKCPQMEAGVTVAAGGDTRGKQEVWGITSSSVLHPPPGHHWTSLLPGRQRAGSWSQLGFTSALSWWRWAGGGVASIAGGGDNTDV